MKHFGFKASNEIAVWLDAQPNRSKAIRDAIRFMMSRELAVDEPQRAQNRPKHSAQVITPEYRVSKGRSSMRGKSGANRCAQAQHMRRRRK